MYTYTTPTITCHLEGVTFTNVDYVRITLQGKDSSASVMKSVPIADIDTNAGTATITLTQAETALLGQGQFTTPQIGHGKVGIQARIHYTDGTVQATNKVISELDDVYDKVVI